MIEDCGALAASDAAAAAWTSLVMGKRPSAFDRRRKARRRLRGRPLTLSAARG
jgi:hypothetical protein